MLFSKYFKKLTFHEKSESMKLTYFNSLKLRHHKTISKKLQLERDYFQVFTTENKSKKKT